MRLALITPDGLAGCLVCRWTWKAPNKKRKGGELTPEEKFKVLEENILAHLQYEHDRIMITRDQLQQTEEGLLNKTYYHGRRPERKL